MWGFGDFILVNLNALLIKKTVVLQVISGGLVSINSSLDGQTGRHFTDDIFRFITVNEKFCILIKISLKFASKGPIDNDQALL